LAVEELIVNRDSKDDRDSALRTRHSSCTVSFRVSFRVNSRVRVGPAQGLMRLIGMIKCCKANP
jgi:hypothetical protein